MRGELRVGLANRRTRKDWGLLGALLLLAALLAPVPVAAAPAATPPAAQPSFLTITLGRTQWVQTDRSCQPKPNSVALDAVARDLAARDIAAVGNVVVNRISETTRSCWRGYTLHPSWRDLAALRTDFGWSFVSAGQSYRIMTTLTPSEQYAESCGSLSAFTTRGHNRARGLFAYPNNKFTDEIQANVVSTCFAFGRRYGEGPTPSTVAFPFYQRSKSVNGGRCNDPQLPCFTINVRNDRRYTSPEYLKALAAPGPGEWATIQWYRFVTGTVQDGSVFEWDCRSADWRLHWTSDPETYCYRDFLSVVDAIPATVTVTDPLTVAQAWGRFNQRATD